MRDGRTEPVRGGSPVEGGGRAPRALASSASIAPVGLEIDIEPEDDALEPIEDEAQQTGPFRIPMQRRRLRGVVAGAVGGCALILIAAVIARASHASNEPRTSANPMKTPATTATAVVPTTRSEPPRQIEAPAPSLAGLTRAVDRPTSEVPSTGTVRLRRPGAAGHVWIDGKKLTSMSALVGCGIHQIKVGARARPRAVDIPCGGEIVILK